MELITLTRIESDDQGTRGVMVDEDGVRIGYTMEPPERNNARNISCIPPGEYVCTWHRSPKYGEVYLVTGVEGRAHILTHPGNVGGDVSLGYRTHTNGCILIGSRLARIKIAEQWQRAVLASRVAVRLFFERMAMRDFVLRVV